MFRQRSDQIVSFKSFFFKNWNAESGENLFDIGYLEIELVGSFDAVAFVFREFLMTERGAGQIKGSSHVIRLEIFEHLNQYRGKTENCIRRNALRRVKRRWQGMKCPVHQRIGIN